MEHPHTVEQLFERLHVIRPYVGGMVEIQQHLPGLGFFPGGDGLWKAPGQRTSPPMAVGGIMVLGNNFQCSANYPALLAMGEEDRQKDATWRNLLSFLAIVGIDPAGCFFTNAYMGLVAGDDPTRTAPGMSDPGFLQRCRTFFLHQMAILQPRLILALGTKVPAFLAPLTQQTLHWRGAKTWADIDHACGGFVQDARFQGIPRSIPIACLLHPSFRGPNLRRRRFRDLTGASAEEALVREALQIAGI
jgi:uracil-DNA glycosylase